MQPKLLFSGQQEEVLPQIFLSLFRFGCRKILFDESLLVQNKKVKKVKRNY